MDIIFIHLSNSYPESWSVRYIYGETNLESTDLKKHLTRLFYYFQSKNMNVIFRKIKYYILLTIGLYIYLDSKRHHGKTLPHLGVEWNASRSPNGDEGFRKWRTYYKQPSGWLTDCYLGLNVKVVGYRWYPAKRTLFFLEWYIRIH